jgi:hypothetical protein
MSWTIFGSSPEMKYQRSSVFISGLGKPGVHARRVVAVK